jgi:hypothetical protein
MKTAAKPVLSMMTMAMALGGCATENLDERGYMVRPKAAIEKLADGKLESVPAGQPHARLHLRTVGRLPSVLLGERTTSALFVLVDGKIARKATAADTLGVRDTQFFPITESVYRLAPGKRQIKIQGETYQALNCIFPKRGKACEVEDYQQGKLLEWTVELEPESDYVIEHGVGGPGYGDRVLLYDTRDPGPKAVEAEARWRATLKKDEERGREHRRQAVENAAVFDSDRAARKRTDQLLAEMGVSASDAPSWWAQDAGPAPDLAGSGWSGAGGMSTPSAIRLLAGGMLEAVVGPRNAAPLRGTWKQKGNKLFMRYSDPRRRWDVFATLKDNELRAEATWTRLEYSGLWDRERNWRFQRQPAPATPR